MNDLIYVPSLFVTLRDTYRRDANRLYRATAAQPAPRTPSFGLPSRFAAAWRAFFSPDLAGLARGGQSA